MINFEIVCAVLMSLIITIGLIGLVLVAADYDDIGLGLVLTMDFVCLVIIIVMMIVSITVLII